MRAHGIRCVLFGVVAPHWFWMQAIITVFILAGMVIAVIKL
jgi:hypothetical protein